MTKRQPSYALYVWHGKSCPFLYNKQTIWEHLSFSGGTYVTATFRDTEHKKMPLMLLFSLLEKFYSHGILGVVKVFQFHPLRGKCSHPWVLPPAEKMWLPFRPSRGVTDGKTIRTGISSSLPLRTTFQTSPLSLAPRWGIYFVAPREGWFSADEARGWEPCDTASSNEMIDDVKSPLARGETNYFDYPYCLKLHINGTLRGSQILAK